LIANPNGISVNGAEFHNISRLTLSAGTVQYDRHGNVGLSIDSGDLEIGSGGLHVVTIDDVTVLGRNIILNGPVESGYLLSLFSGKRYFDYASRTSSGTGANGKGKWAIDCNALGGVSAGRIIMESTDQGVGVRAPRHMAASAGDVTISANGRISLGHIRSNGRIIVRSGGGGIVVTMPNEGFFVALLEKLAKSDRREDELLLVPLAELAPLACSHHEGG